MENNIISKLAPSFLPTSCIIEMTYKCNHKCIFCSCPWEANNNMRKKELSLQEWKDCIKLLTEKGICHITFTGGEALLNKNLFKIIEFASSCKAEFVDSKDGELVSEKKPPTINLISNGTLINNDILAFCKNNNVHLSMSLPGRSTFKIHTQAGNYKKVLENFSKARKMGISTTVNITVTKKNLFELYETISEALIAGANTLLLNRFLPGGRGLKNPEELMLSKEEITEMLDTAEEVLKTANRYGSIGTELPKCIVDTGKYSHLKVSTRCSAAVNFFVVGPSGFIRTCNHSPVELCHFSEYESLKSNSYWKKFTQKDYVPPSCKGCALLHECDGGCREAAHVFCGEINSLDPVFI